MNASIKIDTSQFSAAARQYALETRRELSAELNRRMFYVLLRFFVLLEPRVISSARQKAREYLNAVKPRLLGRGERGRSASKILRAVDLIAQARRIKAGQGALTPQQIAAGESKKDVGKLRRRGIQGQGYVKSAAVRALMSLSKINLGRSFSQFGRAAKVSKRTGQVTKPEQAPNSALMKIAAEYGMSLPSGSQSNVGVFGGTKARVTAARPGLNPSVSVFMEGFVAEAEAGKVNSKTATAFQRALNDEAAQLQAKLAEKAQQVADKYSA